MYIYCTSYCVLYIVYTITNRCLALNRDTRNLRGPIHVGVGAVLCGGCCVVGAVRCQHQERLVTKSTKSQSDIRLALSKSPRCICQQHVVIEFAFVTALHPIPSHPIPPHMQLMTLPCHGPEIEQRLIASRFLFFEALYSLYLTC